jgi:hypothetical protein
MAGGDMYEQAIDVCADAAFTSGIACTGQGDSVSGEGGSDAWGLSWWNAQWSWTNFSSAPGGSSGSQGIFDTEDSGENVDEGGQGGHPCNGNSICASETTTTTTFLYMQPYTVQMPTNLVPETDPKFWDPFAGGFAAAKAALAKRSCAKLFGGQGAATLDATQYRFLTAPPNRWASTEQGGRSVFINPDGAFMNFASLVGNAKVFGRTWTADNIRALIILHELGHELNGITTFQNDRGNETLSRQYSQRVADACF